MSAVFVTGATGIVGSAVLDHLRRRGVEVLAAVRDAQDSARLPEGVATRPFEFGAPEMELDAVLAGADRVFLMRPPQIEDVQRYLFPFIDACNRNGIRQVVFLSLQGVQFNTDPASCCGGVLEADEDALHVAAAELLHAKPDPPVR